MSGIVPVNPAEFMQEIIIEEGLRRPAATKPEQEAAFKQMLVEEIFLKGMFDSENSIYKPETETEEDDALNLGQSLSGMYGGYVRKELAAYLVEQGFLKEGSDSGQ
jgi:hypothetical protein